MKLKDNWKQKTLEDLEEKTWSTLKKNEEDSSYLIETCNLLRKKPLQDFTIEDLRIMIKQEIGLYFLMPLAIDVLRNDLFAEGDMYEGDLLKAVLEVDTTFWNNRKEYWQILNELIKDKREEIKEARFSTINFDNSKH